MKQYILSVDQSTSGTKAIIFDAKGNLVHRCTFDHKQYYPAPGWVEHDPEEIYSNTLNAIHSVLKESNISVKEIGALSISNQRETVIVWDKETGKPIYNAIVWQCQRADHICQDIEKHGYSGLVHDKTGLVLSPYFSAPKVRWILDNIEGAREKAEAGQLLLGTVDSWLIWNLTNRKVHATDYSNASRTLLFNIHKLEWDKELLDIFTIPSSMMPQVKYCDEIFGYTNLDNSIENELPIAGVLGDSHAALFAQNCYEMGMVKATYGTGSSIMMNIGRIPKMSENGLATSIAWGMDGKVDYVFEGNINCTGATIKWMVDDLELIPDSQSCGKIASTVENNGGVYIVPAFVGLGAPYWDSEAKATITGITRGSKKAHIVRAAEESIAYQIKDVLDLMIKEADIKLQELRVDGGPAKDNFLMQFQADILNVQVVRTKIQELSALGTAYMAGLKIGLWKDINTIKSLRMQDLSFIAAMNEDTRNKLYAGWKEAVKRTLTNYLSIK